MKKSIAQTKDGVNLYNDGALWVKMVQKAYAASGLGIGLTKSETISYEDISGHAAAYALQVLIGKEDTSYRADGETK